MRGEDLLAAVLAEPDEIAPRLVYADWLLERGDARGELIQLQCKAAEELGPPREALLAKADKLMRKHRKVWLMSIDHLVRKAEFRRGFVEWVVIEAIRLPGALREILRHEPVRALTVVGDHDQGIVQLLGSEELRYLRELDLSNGQVELKLCFLLALARTDNLVRLWLADNRIHDQGAGALSGSQHLGRLEVLGLSGCGLGPEAAERLAGADLPSLRRLYLARNPLGDRGALALAAAKTLPALRELDLRHAEVGDAGRRALEAWARGGRRVML